jgi:hypothetical protein
VKESSFLKIQKPLARMTTLTSSLICVKQRCQQVMASIIILLDAIEADFKASYRQILALISKFSVENLKN